MAMSKGDLVNAIAERAGTTKKAAGDMLDAFIGTITSEVAKDSNVTITGFGTFKLSHRSARTGVNPQTGAKIQIAATNVPTFKAGKNFKEAVK